MSYCLSMGELVTCQGQNPGYEDSWDWPAVTDSHEEIEQTISLLDAVASNWLFARDQGPLEW